MTTKQTFNVAVEALKVGDELPEPLSARVELVSPAIKWVKVKLDSGSELSLRKGTPVEVSREVKTEEELEAEKAEFMQEMLMDSARRAFRSFDTLRRKMAEDMLKDDPSYALSWDADKLMEAQAKWNWWAHVLLNTGRDGQDIVAAHAAVKANAMEEVLCWSGSRSTSAAHNLYEDAKHKAAISFAKGEWF